MRFDLELDKVSTLDNGSLSYISEVLYNLDDETILPSLYDRKTLFNNSSINKGNINTKRFNNFKEVPSNLFPSYIVKDSISVYDTLGINSLNYILLNGGEFYSCNKSFIWSNLYSKVKAVYSNGYSAHLLGNPDITSISVFTLSLKNPTYIDKEKDYSYVEYDNSSITTTLKHSTSNYSFTVHNNIAYLSGKQISYNDIFIGKGNGNTSIFALPEFPVDTITIEGYDSSEYKVVNGTVIFDVPPVNNEDIYVTYTVSPVVSYRQSQVRDDIVYKPYNITPSSVKFKNGILYAFNSYSHLNIPDKLETTIENINEYGNIYKVTSKLTNSSNIPIPNKDVTINILSDGALFSETNSKEYSSKTAMNGTVSALVFGDYLTSGIYIQKEWINNKTITIPKNLNIDNTGNVFLYFITSDDAILGKLNASASETSISEYYKDSSLSSYYVSGRKIAYVGFNKNSSVVETEYIKPISISNKTNQSIVFRNLFLQGKQNTIIPYYPNNQYVSSTNVSSSYKSGTIPFNKIETYRTYNLDTTEITYNTSIPTGGNIIGYYLVFNKDVSISASFSEGNINIDSNIENINIKNIRSESPFTISGMPVSYRNTTLGDTGYFTVSDYINNDYGLYPGSYGCIYSDAMDKKCIHRNKSYQTYYKPDSNNIFCIHTPEYDATIAEELRCPGVNAKIINPFII